MISEQRNGSKFLGAEKMYDFKFAVFLCVLRG